MSPAGQPTPPPSPLTNLMSGDNTTGHVVTVSVLGGALSDLTSWVLTLAHIPPPTEVEAALGVIFTVIASLIMQTIGNH